MDLPQLAHFWPCILRLHSTTHVSDPLQATTKIFDYVKCRCQVLGMKFVKLYDLSTKSGYQTKCSKALYTDSIFSRFTGISNQFDEQYIKDRMKPQFRFSYLGTLLPLLLI